VLEQFIAHIRLHHLCTPADRLLLAVSGGMDSMVMLHLFQAAGFPHLAVAHANFGLRGEASDEDERFVAQYCSQHDIRFYARQFNTYEWAKQQGVSIQMAARTLRYAWFNELANAENFNYIATAHSLTDAAETFLFNWLHGAAPDALVGIPVTNQRIIRPLLFASRNEIEEYARLHGLAWREDASNATDAYTRNYIRHHIIPHLHHVNAAWTANVARSMEKIKGALLLLEEGLNSIRNTFVHEAPHEIRIDKALFQKHNHPFILYKLIRPFGFAYAQCAAIVDSANSQPGKVFLSSTHQLVTDRQVLIIAPHTPTWPEVAIPDPYSTATLGPYRLYQKKESRFELPTSAHVALLDAEKLVYPMQWRQWKPGDAFFPLGMNHRKKVSDYLIDRKVPLTEKKRVTVLLSDGQIVWVVGQAIDNRFKVTPSTKQVMRLTVEHQADF